jgi:hypothetical protein
VPSPSEVSRRHFLRLAGAAGLTVAATSASGGLLAGCSSGSASSDTLKVGVLAPFTGIGGFIGSVVNDSLDAASRRINDTGGVGGRKVELLLRDSGGDVAATTKAYDELAATKDLLGILWCGALGFSQMLPRLQQAGAPVVAVFEDPFSTGQLFPDGGAAGRPVFQVSVPDVYVKQVLAEYARNDRGYASAAMLYDAALDGGVDLPGASRQHFEEAFRAAGVPVTGVETFRTGDTEFGDQLGRLQASAPQVVYLDGLSDETAAIATALDTMGAGYVDTPTAKGGSWHPHVFGSYRGLNQIWADNAGEAARVGSVTAWHLGGLTFLPTFSIGEWMGKYLGKQPNGGEELPADGLFALLQGLKKAGNADHGRVVTGMETMGRIFFASLPFGFSATSHHSTTKDDMVVLTLERLRGPAPTDPTYELGAEWLEGGALASRGASPTLLVRPTMEANRRDQADVVSRILQDKLGTQCTRHPDGTLGPECKIH